MIIKELTIKNFRSYYGESKFVFSDGLTLIIGDNGDGKTTFFEALKWLFDTSVEDVSLDNVSEMCKSEMEVGDSGIVSVSMIFDHDGEKSVEKSFRAKRTEGGFNTDGFSFRGYETKGVERVPISGKVLIDRCFDAFIQRYSMFKGETTLNVFDSPTALRELVDKFSDVRQFDDLVELTCGLEAKSRRQYDKEARSDKKISEESEVLQTTVRDLQGRIDDKNREIKEKTEAITVCSTTLDELEESRGTSEKYKALMDRLSAKEQEIIERRAQLEKVNPNTALLDKMWILCLFPDVLKEFFQKAALLSEEKRRKNNEFIEARAREQGRLEAQEGLLLSLKNGATGLPWYLPDQKTMEEMIRDEVCKVCGRPAHKGSEAYEFMVARLNEYKKRAEQKLRKEIEKKEIEQERLFVNEYIEEIHNNSISLGGQNEKNVINITNEIRDRLGLNESLRVKIRELEEHVVSLKDEQSRLLIQANVSAETMEKEFKDIKGLFEQKERASNRLAELRVELAALQKDLYAANERYEKLNPEGSMAKVFRDVNLTLKAIANAFKNAKDANLKKFLCDLEDRANEYMEKLSANDFHGYVRLIPQADGNTTIKLVSSNDIEITNPSGSQETIKYIAILFAISDFTHQKRDEDYPLIFDAATSSFGEAKEQEFYNVINNLKKQCIIVTKDFISDGEIRQDDINTLSCSVYRIRKGDNFDPRDLSTIRTIVNKIR